MIYDGWAKRYWIVGAEDDQTPGARKARLHIAVSMTDSPNSWSTSEWRKYTGDQPAGASGPSLNPANTGLFAPDQFALNRIPDRPSIRVDDQYLYIAVREGNAAFSQDKTLMVVLPKAPLMAGGAAQVETSQFIDNDALNGTQTVLHELAVDADFPVAGVRRVYMVALPNHKVIGDGDGYPYTSIRVGAFTKGQQGWGYQSFDIPLEGNQFIGMGSLAANAKGGPAGNPQGLNAFVTWSLFQGAMTRRLADGDRRLWCVHQVRPSAGAPTQLQWYQINLHGWPDSGVDPTFDEVERISLNSGGQPIYIFDGAIWANACGDVALGFTRGAFYNNGWTYPQFWRAYHPAGGTTVTGVVAVGASQYYNPGPSNNPAWADFAGVAGDPLMSSRFFAHHMTVYASHQPGDDPALSRQWESWIAQWNFGSCGGPAAAADFNQDTAVDLQDLQIFGELVSEGDPAADLDESGQIDAMDLVEMLNAIGDEP